MTDISSFLSDFFEEFQYRLDILTKNQSQPVEREVLHILVENLILKYENRVQMSQGGLLTKLIPFLKKPSYDREIEKSIDNEIDRLMFEFVPGYRSSIKTNGKSMLNNSYTPQLSAKSNLPAVVEGNTVLSYWNRLEHEYDIGKYSKTNIPIDLDIALELTPLPGKGQDHCDFFLTDNGNAGIIVCDGVSGDGPKSADIAQFLPRSLIPLLETSFAEELSSSSWQKLLESSLIKVVESYPLQSGSTTFLIAVIDKSRDLIYIGWMGDGHILYFNEELTGYSKLLTPHQNKLGQLTKVVTSQGLLGKPSTQILSGSGGAVILASDGYNLSNGRILRHLYQEVLKVEDMRSGLLDWTNATCEDETLHPSAQDDRSIALICWRTV